jgi:RNA polymerase sigma-70 factor (ECF subfamily)
MDEREQRLGELMRRAQDGDAAAYEVLLRAARDIVCAYARKRLPDVTAAEDVAQDTLMTIHAARHTYDPARPFFPWMFAIARHRLLDYARKHQRIRLREISDDEALATVAVESASNTMHPLAEAVRESLAQLPERQRKVIELLKVQGCSVAEVAQTIGISEANIKVIAHRGYAEIRRKILRLRS